MPELPTQYLHHLLADMSDEPSLDIKALNAQMIRTSCMMMLLFRRLGEKFFHLKLPKAYESQTEKLSKLIRKAVSKHDSYKMSAGQPLPTMSHLSDNSFVNIQLLKSEGKVRFLPDLLNLLVIQGDKILLRERLYKLQVSGEGNSVILSMIDNPKVLSFQTESPESGNFVREHLQDSIFDLKRELKEISKGRLKLSQILFRC